MQSKQKKKGILKLLAKSTIVLTLAVSLALPYGFKTRTKAAETKKETTNQADNDNTAEVSTSDDVLSADSTKPDEYEKYSKIEVYGNSETPFLLSEQNELFMYTTRNSDNNRVSNNVWFNNCDMTPVEETEDYNFVKSINKKNSGANELKMYASDYRFVQGIGFDPLGTGRKEYAGYIGFDGADLNCFVINPKTGELWAMRIKNMDWCKDEDYYVMPNYMSITAGDYDGDHKETLIVYGCGNDDQQIYEFSFDEKNHLNCKAIFDVANVAPNTLYKEKWGTKYKLQLALTTGDFDGDGIDEFAFTIGNGNTSDSAKSGYTKANKNIENYVTKVCIVDFDGGKWSKTAEFSMYDKNGKATKTEKKGGKTVKETYKVRIMQGGSLTASDTDGDGVDELIVAGYTSYDEYAEVRFAVSDTVQNNELVKKYTGEWMNNIGDLDKENYVVSVINATQGSGNKVVYERTELEKLSMEGFTKASIDKSKDSDYVFPHITMASGKTNGKNQPEDVFIDGSLYTFESGSAKKLYTPKLMTQHFDTVLNQGSSNRTSVYWVNNVAVGNFDHNDAGREQFVYTVWFKQYGKDEYYAFLGIEGGCKYEDKYKADKTIKSFGTCTEYGGNNIRADYTKGVLGNETKACQLLWKDHGKTGANAVPVAIDTKDDGLLVKYNSAYYEYSDPQVIAVLQAPPQFKECQEEGSISYTVSNGFGRSKSEGWEESFNVGFVGEFSFKVGPGVKLGVEAGVNNSFSKTYTNSYSISESITVTSAGDTSVIVSRTPIMIYVYDVYNPQAKKWEEAKYAVTVPLTPAYYSMSVEDYNELVDKYNAILLDALKNEGKTDAEAKTEAKDIELVKIKRVTETDRPDLPSVDGDPVAYAKEIISGRKELIENGPVAKVDINGGSKSLSWEREDSSEEDYTHTHGFYVSITVQGGWDVGVEESWMGINVGSETNWSFSTVKSTTSGISIEAEVPNLNKNAMKEAGYSPTQINSYKCSWRLAKWERYLNGSANDAVPFYGFIVDEDVNALPEPVSDLDAEMCNDTETGKRYVNLTWSESESKYRKADSYIVYRVLTEGKETKKVKLATVKDTSYRFDDLDDESVYSFVVVSYAGVKSFESNLAKASLIDKMICDIKITGNKDGKIIYTVYYNDGTHEERTEKLEGIKGEKGDKGDKGETGATGDVGATGAVGAAGAKGDKGDKGDTGMTGATGANGLSAYEIAVKNGFAGTETEWLASLKGEKGADGANGTNGINGTNGTNGTNGLNGKSALDVAREETNNPNLTYDGWIASIAMIAASQSGGNGSGSSIAVTPLGENGDQGINIILGNGYVLSITSDGMSLIDNKGTETDEDDLQIVYIAASNTGVSQGN